MRATQKPGRARGRGQRKPSGGGGNNPNRVYESSGPEGKVRGTPQQIIDKYLTLARDAQTAGDRVAAENFLQHAEHYQRILIQATAQASEQRRDAGDQDTDQTGERGGSAGSEQGGSGSDGGDRGQRRDDRNTSGDSVGGLTTIDAHETGSEGLLVDDESGSAPAGASEQGEAEKTDSPKPRKRRSPARKSQPRDDQAAQSTDTSAVGTDSA